MKWRLGAFVGVLLLMLTVSASACHYWCGPREGLPITTTPDINAVPGQTLTFTGGDSNSVYTFAAHDENGWLPITTINGPPFEWTVPIMANQPCGQVRYYTVTWTATRTTEGLSCITKGCIKIKVVYTCPDCPQIPDYCEGETLDPNPLQVTLPAWMSGAVCEWNIDGAVPPVTGNPASWNAWSTLAPGPHSVTLTIKVGGVTVFTCTMNFNVRPKPSAGVTWS